MTSSTTVRDSDAAPAAVPQLARLPVGIIAAVVAAVHLVLGALGRGYWFDEALMLAIGRHHLDWGSADQPPVAPALAGLADALAPGVNGVLRIVPSLSTAGAVVVAALIARELGGDRRAQVLTALAQATGLWVTMFGHFVTPYSLEPLQWALLLWLLVRWTRVRDDRLLLAVGPLLGLAALTKFQVILLGAVLVVAIGVAGPRAMLRRPAFWWAALVGALIASPTLVWQAVHGWPQLRMTSVVAQESILFGGPGPNAVAMLLLAGLLGTVLVVVGTVAAFTAPRLRPYRFVAVTFLLLWVVFAVTVGRAYYLCGLHGAVAALGAVWFQQRREAGRRRWSWVAWPAGVLSVALATTMLSASVAAADPAVPERIVTEVARVRDGLPPDRRDRAVVVGDSYIFAAYVDTADPALGLPPGYSGNRSYGYFDPPPDDRDVVIFLGKDPGLLAPTGVTLRPVADLGDGNRIWLGEGMTRPWSQVWPQLRTLVVD